MKKIFFILSYFIVNICIFAERLCIYTKSFYFFDKNIDKIVYSFFPSSLFQDNAQKLIWIDKLQSIYQAYKTNFIKIEFFYNENQFDVIFYLKNSDKFYFSDGKMLPEEKLKDSDKYDSYFYNYFGTSNYHIYSKYLFSKTNEYDFYHSIYGKNKEELFNNLIKVKIFKKNLYFNNKNYAVYRLKKVAEEIENINDKEIKDYINKKIKILQSFHYRNIAYQNKLSLHSFGIVIDIIPRYKNKFIYWYWSIPFVKEWWNIKESDKVEMPSAIIKVFENNFFCWGGKWERFDIMHFEYKPEIFYRRLRF